ncbi:MAG: bifunctional phosphoribosylaminoimidazolecarboxamide formyltransferase/IMP cyclohydrolase [Chloroflexi bacterium]|nr:bifunctional phosphoribosylaminoimidazolecarboxamide formyltransferase/IMP cyclohydrolase [Chloroflexota bacterium]
MRAIISVHDKSNISELARGLAGLGIEVYSTGGTKKALETAGVPVKSISEMTGFPEILDGRVKTLHPLVHGGILARRGLPDHMRQLAANKIETIDLVAVNLYPFVQTVTREGGVSLEDALENIDIGGPTLIRAAAKNFPDVIVLVDPTDYKLVLEKLAAGGLDLAERQRLARKAFQHVAVYDTAIAEYLRQGDNRFPEEMTVALNRRYGLRYGENPHQQAAFYAVQSVNRQDTGVTWAEQLWGKELSFNNILDADAAWNVATDFAAPTVAVIKHTNPCGLASHDNLAEAYTRALSGDPVAAFGGIVSCNQPVDRAAALEISKTFYEILIAPEYQPDALEALKKRKDLRILRAKLPPGYGGAPVPYLDFRRVKGGVLVQTSDSLAENDIQLKTVTRRAPTGKEVGDLLFAWRAVKHVKSNAIVLAKEKTLIGMGAGQPSRIVSTRIAAERAGEKSRGSVLASDAMFPFPDVVEAAVAMGVTAIIQPGGSIRDEDSISAANEHDLAMVFTGVRHFRH